jgi:hypothetical protein
MMEIEFKRELNQCHDIQKSKDDMEKASVAAAAKSPSRTEVVARGRISDQASPPAKRKARGQPMLSSSSTDHSALCSSLSSSDGKRLTKGKKQQVTSQKRKTTKKARVILLSLSSSTSSLSKKDSVTRKRIHCEFKKMEKKINKKLTKSVLETRKMIEKNLSS